MRKFLITIMIMHYVTPVLAQSLEFRGAIFSFITNPTNGARFHYKAPTNKKKGELGITFYKDDWFTYPKDIFDINIGSYSNLMRCFVLKDSAAYLDTAMLIIAQNNSSEKIMQVQVRDSSFSHLPLWRRAVVLTDAMPVIAAIRFCPLVDGRHDVELIIQAKDWELRTDIYKLDEYAMSLAIVIYDFVIDKEANNYRDIIIRSYDKTLIHEKVYIIQETEFLKQFYKKN